MKEFVIEVTLNETGTLEAETFGFKGKTCETELLDLLQSDFVIESIEKKDDYYKPAEEDVVSNTKVAGRKI